MHDFDTDEEALYAAIRCCHLDDVLAFVRARDEVRRMSAEVHPTDAFPLGGIYRTAAPSTLRSGGSHQDSAPDSAFPTARTVRADEVAA